MNDSAAAAVNLLGATGLLISGVVRDAVTEVVGAGGALGEALIAIRDQPGRTADWLAAVLHVSQPGTAHLVRKLTDNGWVERGTARDGRSRPLRLTPAGQDVADAALRARQQALRRLVARLSAEQHAQLADIAGALLGPEARDERRLARLCRLCDRGSCPQCPVHEGWQRAGGH